jgi:type IX secretion system PorP/SprF family membrane protein
MRKTKYILFALLLSSLLNLRAQQDLQYSHYVFSPHIINPAITGTRDVLNWNLSYRNQWVNFPGAPKTIATNITAPFADDKIGLGLNAVNEQIGPKQSLNLAGSFAYKLRTGKDSRLSMGLRLGIQSFTFKGSLLQLKDIENNAITTDINRTSPNIDAGIYHYSKKHYFGIGINHLVNTAFNANKDNQLIRLKPHYYLNAAYAFPISANVDLNPTLLLRYVSGSKPLTDIGLNAHLYNRLWVGTLYRVQNSLAFLFNLSITQQLRLGYVFDWQNNQIGQYTNNSHELFLGFDFNHTRKKIANARYL